MKLSCVACRQKKIKCDRESPCSHCIKAGTACIPQTRAKAIRRAKKPDEALLQRLKQLESIVSRLDHSQTQTPRPISPQVESFSDNSSSATLYPAKATSSTYSEAGKLVRSNGQTKYVPTGFWMILTNQIAQQVSELLGDNSESGYESDEPLAFPSTSQDNGNGETVHTEFVLGFTSDSMTLRLLHPAAEQIKKMWSIFLRNCRPVVKTVYIPSGSELVRRATTDLSSLSHIEEAWMFSLYYLVSLSVSPEECLQYFGQEKSTALERFRWATEQALARAGFLLTQDLLLLEAFQLYCIALSRHVDNFTVRAMINLLVNVAHSMGLHRDGEQFGLPPFDVEWRRKLWWGVRTIDLRSSLDYDVQSLLIGRWSDTKFPLNLRDDDIWPGMTETPQARTETTELSFTLLRWELTDAMLEIGKMGQSTDQQRIDAIEPMNAKLAEIRTRIYDKYLRNVKGDDVVADVVAWTSVRLFEMLMSRMWLIINQPLINREIKSSSKTLLWDEAYRRASLALTLSNEIEDAVRYVTWSWLFKRMVDWQSVCIVLVELCQRTEEVDDLWRAVDRAFSRWSESSNAAALQLEKPLRRLYQKARKIRQQASRAHTGFSQADQKVNDYSQTGDTQSNLGEPKMDLLLSDVNQNIPDTYGLALPLEFGEYDNFTMDDLPPLDQFGIFETAIANDTVTIDWNKWTDSQAPDHFGYFQTES